MNSGHKENLQQMEEDELNFENISRPTAMSRSDQWGLEVYYLQGL